VKLLWEGGEPFYFPGNQVGCLLIHGFTGTPKEMRTLGEHLAAEGYTVLAVRLFGHATRMEDLTRARWRDWLACVEDGYHLLRAHCQQPFLVGLSMGGALALLAGSYLPTKGIVSVSTPYTLPDPRARLLGPLIPVLSTVWRYSPKGPAHWVDPRAAEGHLDYPAYPVRAVRELHWLLAHMRARLGEIEAPVLLIHSRDDQGVPPEHAERLLADLPPARKDLFWLQGSGHVVLRDAQRQRAFARISQFLQQAWVSDGEVSGE
jgi:carboxylesterase